MQKGTFQTENIINNRYNDMYCIFTLDIHVSFISDTSIILQACVFMDRTMPPCTIAESKVWARTTIMDQILLDFDIAYLKPWGA